MQISKKILKFDNLNTLINSLWTEKNKRESLDIAINLANEVMRILGVPEDELETGDSILDKAFSNAKFKNQKMEAWFVKHPYLGNGRLALYHYDEGSLPVESKFYQLNRSATKARISATTQMTSNWEDSDLTMLPDYKVGIDFFLNVEANSLLMVISKYGNLRVLELSEELSNTQIDIFNKLKDSLLYDGIDPKTGDQMKFEPQRTIHNSIWNALELKEVNKQFYYGISNHFESLTQHLRRNVPAGVTEEEVKEGSKIFSIRLLNRLVFIWFLRKKDIINEDMKYFTVEENSDQEHYEAKLKKLFFSVLNTPIDKRDVPDNKTPYLNGGLFEAHVNDWTNAKVTFPFEWFTTLYNHLNSFNFTTDESSPEYEQIAIDPEMLGRVFENLLASILPETSESANERNNKGAFYTPRDIVTFMNKESLKEYIKTMLDNPKDYEGVDRLIDMSDSDFLEHRSTGLSELWGNRSESIKSKIIEFLNNFKVLDPACGSGAFPLSMMQILVKTYDRLSAIYDEKLEKLRLGRQNEKNDIYQTKLYIINKILFGSDIEPMAIEISKLRAWLSLIIDNTGEIEPLPNLDFNFVCANSLIPLENEYQINIFEDHEYHEKFLRLKDQFFNAHSLEDKKKIKDGFYELYDSEVDESDSNKRIQQLRTWHPFESDEPAQFFDSKIMFSVDKFDLVVGNPPYIHLESIKGKSKNIYRPLNYETYEARGDIYTLFFEMGINNLKNKGVLCFITSNKWMRSAYGKKLRNHFYKNTNPRLLIDMGHGVFESATVDTSILLLQKAEYRDETLSLKMKQEARNSGITNYVKRNATPIKFNHDESWMILSPIESSIKEKIERNGTLLLERKDINIYNGLKTGLNKAFIINEMQRQTIINNCITKNEQNRTENLIRPVLRGKDIKRNKYNWAGLYIIITHNGYKKNNQHVPKVNIDDYPAIKKHLDQYWDHLSNRQDKGDTPYNLRNCAYIENFKKSKIFWADISTKPAFAKVETEIYINNTAYMIVGGPEWLVDYLNSKIVEWYFPKLATDLGAKAVRYFKQFVELIPIPDYFDKNNPFDSLGFTDEEIELLNTD